MNLLAGIPSCIVLHRGTSAMIACGFGIAVVACARRLEIEEARSERARREKETEFRAVADKILLHARKAYHRFPTGDVVVCERDLAEELRKRPDLVATALNILLGERKVQRAPLNFKDEDPKRVGAIDRQVAELDIDTVPSIPMSPTADGPE